VLSIPLLLLAALPETSALLAPARVAALPLAERAAWERYLEGSREQGERDRQVLQAEVEARGAKAWIPASAGRPFALLDKMDDAAFRSPEARRTADVLVSFQTPAGGWSKNLDFAQPRAPGQGYTAEKEWLWVGTFDNDATTGVLRFLAETYRAQRVERHREAFLAGIDYVLRAQFPNGCWPQVYPLQGGYHDAATFNDEAMIGTLTLLRDVARGALDFVPDPTRRRAGDSVARGVACVLDSQVVVDGRRTVWGAQHDPLTLVPVKARAYEHASLSGSESVGIVDFLMDVDEPAARVETAVRAAVAWFRTAALYGYDYPPDRERVARAGAGPLWARFYEIGTNRPIFSNRDGVVRYEWEALGDERRHGYAWYTDRPTAVLARYPEWARRHDCDRD
jgi:PelA/Pel-15E family pectate lyase